MSQFILFDKLQQSLEMIHFYAAGQIKFSFTKSFSGTRAN